MAMATIHFKNGSSVKVINDALEITQMIDTLLPSEKFLMLSNSFGLISVRASQIIYVTNQP